jgi:hypothetical protein
MGRARALTQVCKRLHTDARKTRANTLKPRVEHTLLFSKAMTPLLLTLVLSNAPAEPSLELGVVLFVAGEAGFAAVSAQPWLERSDDVASVTPVFSRFDVKLTAIPLLGPVTTMLLEGRLQEDGWQGRFVVGAASLSLQTLGCTLMALSSLEDESAEEGPLSFVRATTIGFRIMDGGAGGVVTLSGVAF